MDTHEPLKVGGDYVGRDKISNSDRWVKWVAWLLAIISLLVAYWIYYFTSIYNPRVNPEPPTINTDVGD